MNLNDVKDLNDELERALINFNGYHNRMYKMRDYYINSAFYKPKTGQANNNNYLRANMLKVFADKNIHYTSRFPTIKVPTTGADEQQRQAASVREKILYAVHQKSGTPLLQRKWAWDGTVKSVAVSEVGFDLDKRCAWVRRHEPSYVCWQLSNDNDRRVTAFWAVFPITKDEAKKRYGVEPTTNGMSANALQDKHLTAIDGKDWFMMAIRWDDTHRVAWIGNRMIEDPHQHQMGEIPVDICMPFDDGNDRGEGSFYLEQMLPLQAELNHTLKQRAKIASRMANPLIWSRGVIGKQLDEVKAGLKRPGGGYVPLKLQGELGILQVNDVKLLNEHMIDVIDHMMRISGFSAAAFGESVGANTSGDALGMYFTPTQRLIENQNIAWTAFHQSINAKILRAYDRFAMYGEQFSLSGYSPRSTVVSMDGDKKYGTETGVFSISFDKSVIGGNYDNIVIPNPITPKNEIEEKRWVMEAVKQKFISHTTGYEMIDIQSPEDELELLKQEQSEPLLNPEGTESLMQAFAQQPPVSGDPQSLSPDQQPGLVEALTNGA